MSERENSSRQPVGALLEELSECCRSTSLSENGLLGIIERHGVAPNNNDPGIDYKFFLEACRNETVMEEIIRYLLEYFPNAVRFVDEEGKLPLHIICGNISVTRGMVQLLIDAFPESIRHENSKGHMPLHRLCRNDNLDEEVGLEILKLLLERLPESVRHADTDDNLPIHFAAARQSPDFCRTLIEAYPGSERISNVSGFLPFHFACGNNTVTTAKYFYQLYPESISVVADNGFYPIHYATLGITYRKDKPEIAISMIRFLLDCDPDVVHMTYQGKFPFYWVCFETSNTYSQMVSLNLLLKALQMFFDTHPEAIERNEVPSNVTTFHRWVRIFINNQLTYARRARDHHLMHSQDENGQLPLHRALCGEARLGSVKLLVKGNLSAVQTPDGDGALPLHLACLHYDDARIVEYLINLDLSTLRAFDGGGNTALHYACRGANHAIIALLLEKYGSMSVSKRNTNKQLPIDLLFASEAVSDKESAEYTESIYRLLKAYPETINYGLV